MFLLSTQRTNGKIHSLATAEVEITSAQQPCVKTLLPGIIFSPLFSISILCVRVQDYEASSSASVVGNGSVRRVQSVAVRISTTKGEDKQGSTATSSISSDVNNAFRTAPFYVKALARGGCSPQWYEGHRRLRVNKGTTNLRAEILARVDRGGATFRRGGSKTDISNRQRQQLAPPAEGVVSNNRELAGLAANEIVLASASVDLDAVRDGFNYVQLFSPENPENYADGGGVSGGGSKRPEGEEGGRTRASIAAKMPLGTALGVYSQDGNLVRYSYRKLKSG